jgi:excisionase family DNA binding protein
MKLTRPAESNPLGAPIRPCVQGCTAGARTVKIAQRPFRRGRHPNYRLVKIHRSYTVEEIAQLLSVHKNTVRNWFKQGLPTIDLGRPALVLGSTLSRFLQERRQRGKTRCAPGEIYCVKCRVPVQPAGDMADYLPVTATLGTLRGTCPACETQIYRRVSGARLEEIRGRLDITIPQGQLHIRDSRSLFVNCDSNGGGCA